MPRLLYPSPNSAVPYRNGFGWTRVPGAAGYEIQVAERQSFVDPYVEDVTPYPFFMAELPVLGPLWWRVRAVDDKGEPGPWSVTRGFSIEPPPLAASVRGITFTPTSVPGGGSVDALVTLDTPAPREGATVKLSANGSSRVSIPPRLLFPASQISVQFSIETTSAGGNDVVEISANSRGEPRVATLRIGPPRPPAMLAALAVRPGVLAAGGTADGMVTLAEPAISKTVVQLASNDPSRVVVPPAVTVLPRANGASFAVQALRSTTSSSVTVTASLEGVVKTAALELTAAEGQDPLPPPVQIAPVYRALTSYSGSGEFSWSSVMSAASYTIELSYGRRFDSAMVISRMAPATSVTIAPLAPGLAWWRVRANDAKGSPGRWSTPRPVLVR